jgi:hypothetical protein
LNELKSVEFWRSFKDEWKSDLQDDIDG